MEAVRTIDGDIDEIKDRLSSTGDTVVELHLLADGGKEKCLAYAEKADALKVLLAKMQGLASKNGVGHIRDLHVRVEITGIVKNTSASKDLIVTAFKLQN